MKATGFQKEIFKFMNEKNMNKQTGKQNGKQTAKANKQNVRDCGGKCKPGHEENCK